MNPTLEVVRARTGASAALPSLVAQLSAARSMDEVSTAVTHTVRRLLGADGATFVLRESDRCYYADEDAISPLWKGQRFPLKACISGWCMTHGQTVAIPDIYRDPRIPADAYRPTFVRSLAMAPVRRDHPIAALGAYWSETREASAEEVELLQAIADIAALSIAYVQLQQARGAAGAPSGAPAKPLPTPAQPAPLVATDAPQPNLISRLLRAGARPNSPAGYAMALATVAAATAGCLALGPLAAGGVRSFAAYLIAVLASTVLGGARAGVLALVSGGVLADWLFLPGRAPVSARIVDTVVYVAVAGLTIWIVERYRAALARFATEDARRVTVTREMQHRNRNTLSVVEAIVRQTLRDAPEQAQMVTARIRAGLAPANLTATGEAAPATLRGLLAAELAAFDLARFTLEGDDDGPVAAELRGPLMLVAHELATNAVKHGALSESEGRVSVRWWTVDGRRLVRWTETGGPAVTPPEGRGYGSQFLRRVVEGFGGAFRADYRPSGLVAEIALPFSGRRRG